MTGTSAGAKKSAWHEYLKGCAKNYRERQKADKAAKDEPQRSATAIRQEKEEKERIATKRRVKGKPVHDASHRIKEADAGKAGKAGKEGRRPRKS